MGRGIAGHRHARATHPVHGHGAQCRSESRDACLGANGATKGDGQRKQDQRPWPVLYSVAALGATAANHHAQGVQREARVAGGNAHEGATQGAEKHRCHCAQGLGVPRRCPPRQPPGAGRPPSTWRGSPRPLPLPPRVPRAAAQGTRATERRRGGLLRGVDDPLVCFGLLVRYAPRPRSGQLRPARPSCWCRRCRCRWPGARRC